jgi:hypothetical protein
MAKAQRYTTVAASRGTRVHAVALTAPTLTVCGRKFSGWTVSPMNLSCANCKLAILKNRLEELR